MVMDRYGLARNMNISHLSKELNTLPTNSYIEKIKMSLQEGLDVKVNLAH